MSLVTFIETLRKIEESFENHVRQTSESWDEGMSEKCLESLQFIKH